MNDVLLVERDGPVSIVTLNRPERLNALNVEVTEELEHFWKAFEADGSQRVAIVTGAGERAFCVGADVKEQAAQGGMSSQLRGPDVRQATLFAPTQHTSKPSICAVNGICAGGGLHFVAECDVVIAADHATFMDPHVTVGQVAALEPIYLARRIPLGAVLRMVFTGRGESMSAPRAYELGLVSEVVPGADLLPAALRLAHTIAANSPAAIAASRRAIWDSLDRPLSDAFQHGWDLIRAHWDHPDFLEGVTAFAEKRDPRWAE